MSKRRSDGEGSIYQRHIKDCPAAVDGKRPEHPCKGKWVGVYVSGWHGGRPVRKKVTATSKAGAASRLRDLRAAVEAGRLPSGRIPTCAEWMTYWLNEIAAKKVRPSTLRGYRTYVDCYIVPLLGDHRLDKLSPEHISAAWAYMQDVGRPGVPSPRPLSSTSAHQAHRVLARALKVAHQRGHVTRNAATLLDAPQPAHPQMAYLKLAEAKRVLAAAETRRNGARWMIALSLGLRQGEALGLCWDAVDLEAGTLHVTRSLGRVKGQGLVLGQPKSAAGNRRIALPGQLAQALRAHRAQQAAERLAAGSWWTDGAHGGFVFARVDGRPIDPKADWSEWKALLAEVDVDDSRLHAARHTAATMLLAMGVDVRTAQEILGHSRITQTQAYQHVVDELHRDAAEKMGAFWA